MAMALVNVVGCEPVVLPCCMRHKGLARRCSHGSQAGGRRRKAVMTGSGLAVARLLGRFLGLLAFFLLAQGQKRHACWAKPGTWGRSKKRVFLAAQGLAAGRSVN